MSRAQRNHEIQAFAPHRSDQPFAIGTRFRCTHGRAQDPQPKTAFELLVPLPREDRIAVMDQELVSIVAGNGFSQLLQRARCGGVCGHVVMENPTAPYLHHRGQHSYVSARRLFWEIRELQAVADFWSDGNFPIGRGSGIIFLDSSRLTLNKDVGISLGFAWAKSFGGGWRGVKLRITSDKCYLKGPSYLGKNVTYEMAAFGTRLFVREVREGR